MYSVMSALFGAALLTVSGFCSAFAAEVKIGFLGGITGPAASVVPAIRDGAHLALTQINRQGGILDSRNAVLVVRDTGCLGENKALSAAQSLVFEELVSGVIGAVCSAASLKVAENVTVPAGVTMISPASTTPQLTTLQDNDLVFRTLASDALEVEMLAEIAKENVGGGLLVAYPDDAFGGAMLAAFTQKLPGLTGSYAYAGQEEKKGTYRKQLAELAEEGGKSLAIIGYGGGAAKSVLRNAHSYQTV